MKDVRPRRTESDADSEGACNSRWLLRRCNRPKGHSGNHALISSPDDALIQVGVEWRNRRRK